MGMAMAAGEAETGEVRQKRRVSAVPMVEIEVVEVMEGAACEGKYSGHPNFRHLRKDVVGRPLSTSLSSSFTLCRITIYAQQ